VYNDLVNLYGSLDNLYVQNASWVMSSQTRASLMGLISTTGQPILQADVNGNPFSAIFGRPIVIDESRPRNRCHEQSNSVWRSEGGIHR
jgi:HK97 family phage major capsid protein